MNNYRFLIPLLALVVALAPACNGCSSDHEDADADERIQMLASHLPATSDVVLVVPETGQLPETLDYTMGRLAHFRGDIETLERNINHSLGFRVTDPESWDAAGFDLDGSMMISMIGARPVVAAHIDDENSFRTNVIGRLRQQFDIQTPIESRTFGGRDFQVSGAGMADDMVWYIEGSTVVLVMPPFNAFDVFETGTATAIANKLGDMDPEATLAHSDGFDAFYQSIGSKYPTSLYVDAKRYFDRPAVANDQVGVAGFDTIVRSLVDWSHDNTDAAGIGFRAGDQRIELHGFAAGDDEVVDQARQALGADDEFDINGLLTENTTVAVRTAVDLNQLLDTYLENLPDDQRRTFQRQLSRADEDSDMDMNDDVLGALSGHSLLVFYGLAGNAGNSLGQFMGGDLFGGLRTLSNNSGLMAHVQFSDADKMDALLDYTSESVADLIDRRPLEYDGDPVDGFQVIEPAEQELMPLRMVTGERTATLTTAGINEQSAYQYLTDAREEGRLADDDTRPLGAEFATADAINGIYVNFDGLADSIRQFGAAAAGYANVIDALHEVLLTAGVEDDGLHARTQITFSEPLEDD